MRSSKTPYVMPREMSVTIAANAARFPEVFAAVLGLPPLKLWQRMYLRLLLRLETRKINLAGARGISKERLRFAQMFGFDPFDLTEDDNAEEEA